MAATINTNIASLTAQRNLGVSQGSLNTSIQRLSSGLRINSAKDDAAGMAISERFTSQIRGMNQAVRNANDGISAIAIADSALGEIGNVLSRLAELSEQSANGVYSSSQRSALSNEFVALGSEIERIAVTTQFNGVALLSGNSAMVLQVGFNSGSTSQIRFTGVSGTLTALGLANMNASKMTYSINDITTTDAQSASRNALDAVNSAIASLATQRGLLGATESRLNVAINNLTVARENYASAESRIRDTDVAQEAAQLTRMGILQQAGAAVLAQANQQPQLALTLLR